MESWFIGVGTGSWGLGFVRVRGGSWGFVGFPGIPRVLGSWGSWIQKSESEFQIQVSARIHNLNRRTRFAELRLSSWGFVGVRWVRLLICTSRRSAEGSAERS